jgi:serine protease Do
MRLKSTITTVVLALSLTTPHLVRAQSTDSPSPNPIEGLFRGLGNIIDSAFSQKDREFRTLVENKKFREAADFYTTEQAHFNKDRRRHSDALRAITESLNKQFEASLMDGRNILSAAIGRSETNTNLEEGGRSQLGIAIQTGETRLYPYNAIQLLKEKEFRSTYAIEIEELLSKARSIASREAPVAFVGFDHFSGKSFFVEYPITSRRDQFLREQLPRINEKIEQATPDQLGTFLRVYNSDLHLEDKRQIARAQISSLRRSAPSNSTLVTAARSQEIAGRYSIRLERPEYQIAEVLPGENGAFDFGLVIANDINASIAKVSQHDALSIAESADSPLTIFVRVGSANLERKVISRRNESSRYQSGTRSVPNPEYEVARQRYLQAENSYNQSQLRNSFAPPAQNWGQVLGRVIGEAAVGVARDRAFQDFQNTSPTTSVNVYESYNYSISEIEVVKSAVIEAIVVDPVSRRSWKLDKEFSESKRFSLAFNVKEQDENISSINSRYTNEAEVNQYASRPVSWSARDIVDSASKAESDVISLTPTAYLSPVTQVANAAGQVASRARNQPERPLVVHDARLDSVVVIQSPKGAMGAGFFVDSNLILTNYHVVDGAGFATIKLKNGQETYGKVIKTDPGRDLALIRVSEAGSPLRFSVDTLTIGQTVEAIGHPSGLQFSLTRGVVSAVRKYRTPDQGEILMIQTDAPISPGNSGGPLFAGLQVIGVNTMKRMTRGAEGLGFALHATEVQQFLAQR